MTTEPQRYQVFLAMLEALRCVAAVDAADKSGAALVSCQGQAMDGFTKLANYDATIPQVVAAISLADKLGVIQDHKLLRLATWALRSLTTAANEGLCSDNLSDADCIIGPPMRRAMALLPRLNAAIGDT